MAIVLSGQGLTIENLVKVARHGEKVELHPDTIGIIYFDRATIWAASTTHC